MDLLKMSCILGGAARGGPISIVWLRMWNLRSGELFPCGMFPRGARAGIRDGLLFDFTVSGARIELANPPRGPVPKFVGVLARGAPRRVLARSFSDFNGTLVVVVFVIVDGADCAGVFDRGGAALDCVVARLSRYRSPQTRNGRPYSFSQDSSVFLSVSSTLGNSLAIRLRDFSSRSSLPGSRFSPFWPRSIRREASWLEFARSSRSLTSALCLSIRVRVGARCSLSASSRMISDSCAESKASL